MYLLESPVVVFTGSAHQIKPCSGCTGDRHVPVVPYFPVDMAREEAIKVLVQRHEGLQQNGKQDVSKRLINECQT